MEAAAKLRLKTGAKLNLFLRVVGLRGDGFHELESIFHSLDFADDIQVEARSDGDIVVSVETGDTPVGNLPAVKHNLVYKAARRLQDLCSVPRGAAISLRKRIPVGGGLGGGSSNAAGTLLALDELWELGLERETLLSVAADIGSDVPYCVAGGTTCLVTGRGEHLSPLPLSTSPFWFVLGISDEPLFTAEVYDEFDRHPADEDGSTAALTMALGAGDPQELGSLLFNGLEAAAFRLRPALVQRKQALVEAGALGAALSGSGPTLFGVAHDERHARDVAASVSGSFDRVVVASSSSGCVYPA